MGKIILCTGKMANKAWVLQGGVSAMSGCMQIWSIEELCYYVYQNIYGIERSFFSPELFDWLEQECDMKDTADKLRWLSESGYGMRDMTVALLCSADYYTEQEIIDLIRVMNELENMPEWKRKKRVADDKLKNGYYASARAEYEMILEECEMTEEEKGILLHNIGVARLHTVSLSDAADSFYMAYRCGHHPESLKLCLLALRMANQMEEYQRILDAEAVPGEFVRSLEEEWNRSLSEADQSGQMQMLHAILRERREGMVTDAFEKLAGMIDNWKKNYRSGVTS